jgi:hypothetical protein
MKTNKRRLRTSLTSTNKPGVNQIRWIDVCVLTMKPHPDQATTHPGAWAVQFRADHGGRTHTFWRWYNVRETNENDTYITPSNEKKPSADKILADFWRDTFLDLHGFDFQEFQPTQRRAQ